MKSRKKQVVPWSEMSFPDKLKETKAAIARIEQQLETERASPNRTHAMLANLYECMASWQNTYATLLSDPRVHAIDMKDR